MLSRAFQISVDTFLIGNAYLDVATVGCVSRYTAGHVYHYTQFTRAADAERLTADIVHDLTRETGFEAVMRIRYVAEEYPSLYPIGQHVLRLRPRV